MLPDHQIAARIRAGDLVIDPEPVLDRLQPASVDITLGDTYRVFHPPRCPVSLASIPDNLSRLHWIGLDGLTLAPGDFVLATSAEHFTIPADVCAFLHGRSTLGRLGLTVHVTAGLVDPGYTGMITLEVVNIGPLRVTLHVGDPIGQVTFEQLDEAALRPYGHDGLSSRYQNQAGAAGPRAVPTVAGLASVVELRAGGPV